MTQPVRTKAPLVFTYVLGTLVSHSVLPKPLGFAAGWNKMAHKNLGYAWIIQGDITALFVDTSSFNLAQI